MKVYCWPCWRKAAVFLLSWAQAKSAFGISYLEECPAHLCMWPAFSLLLLKSTTKLSLIWTSAGLAITRQCDSSLKVLFIVMPKVEKFCQNITAGGFGVSRGMVSEEAGLPLVSWYTAKLLWDSLGAHPGSAAVLLICFNEHCSF